MTIYKKCIIIIDVSRMERFKEVERSIIKKYRKEIWSRFTKTVRDYELISPNDHVMVCKVAERILFYLLSVFKNSKDMERCLSMLSTLL